MRSVEGAGTYELGCRRCPSVEYKDQDTKRGVFQRQDRTARAYQYIFYHLGHISKWQTLPVQSWSELLRPARWQARGMALRLMIRPPSDEADSGCGGRHALDLASLGESLPFEGVVRREVPSNS